MPITRGDLRAGTYLADPTRSKLYEVEDTYPVHRVCLVDCSSSIEEPQVVRMLATTALKTLQLVRHAEAPGHETGV